MPAVKPYRIKPIHGSRNLAVVYWDASQQKQVERSTGCQDPESAEKEAAKIYGQYLQSNPVAPKGPKPIVSLEKTAVKYLEQNQAQYRPDTFAGLFGYFERLAREFPSLTDVTRPKVREYIGRRLKEVSTGTVRHELSCLRVLLNWAEDVGIIPEAPSVPTVRRGVSGTRYARGKGEGRDSRVAADFVTPAESERILALLPEFCEKHGEVRPTFPIRARFLVQYDLCLRPATMDRIRSPENWRPGQEFLELDSSVMKKNRTSRKMLTPRAKEALELIYRGPGLLFGQHDYRPQLQKAAAAVLDEYRANRFCGQHFRSHRATHLSLEGIKPTALQHLMDHEALSTTSRYIRTSDVDTVVELRRLGVLPSKGEAAE